MAVKNIFGPRNLTNIIGPQFEQEATKLKITTHDFTTTNEETIYTVPVGKTLYVSKLVMMNVSGSNGIVQVKFNNLMIWYKDMVANTTEDLDFPVPVALVAGSTIKGTVAATVDFISVIGWLV